MISEEFLNRVNGPARYVGGEWNAVMKDPASVLVRFAFCYPDAYEIGMSHLGSRILYHVLNSREDTWCERAYYPQPDAVAVLREMNLPLSTLESGEALLGMDIVGFTLQHELTYTTILGMLDLGGIPVLAAERTEAHPLILAGGPCAYNPEPLADFIDAFAIGDGEDVVGEICEAVGAAKQSGMSRLATPGEPSPRDAVVVYGRGRRQCHSRLWRWRRVRGRRQLHRSGSEVLRLTPQTLQVE